MKRQQREHGRIMSVETKARGDALAEDALAGATTLVVGDAADFDEDGGWLVINDQVVEFTEVDDDEGTITLASGLASSADEGDAVHVWSTLYEEVVDYQEALVELDGEYDNPEPVVAEVAEGVGDLPEGDRGVAGESCTLLRVSDDEWEIVGVGGRARTSSDIRWEQDDTYTLTAADITAGTATMSLTHRPIAEALTCVLASVPQSPTEWTIDYPAQTLTVPLDGWEKAGDVLWVHYAYRKGIATAVIDPTVAVVTGRAETWPGTRDPFPLPDGTQVGDFMIVALAGGATVADSRLQTLGGTTEFLAGAVTTLDPLTVGGDGGSLAVAVLRGATNVATFQVVDFGAYENPVALPAVAADTVAAMVSAGFSVVDGMVYVAGFDELAQPAPGKVHASIHTWTGNGPSPATTADRSGGLGWPGKIAMVSFV